MTLLNSLEELIFQEGKILKKSDKTQVRVVPVGPPVSVYSYPEKASLEEISEKAPKDANAYILGEIEGGCGEHFNPVQYYEVVK